MNGRRRALAEIKKQMKTAKERIRVLLNETARERTGDSSRKTAREGTQVPLQEEVSPGTVMTSSRNEGKRKNDRGRDGRKQANKMRRRGNRGGKGKSKEGESERKGEGQVATRAGVGGRGARKSRSSKRKIRGRKERERGKRAEKQNEKKGGTWRKWENGRSSSWWFAKFRSG